jgi:hypothetical protein
MREINEKKEEAERLLEEEPIRMEVGTKSKKNFAVSICVPRVRVNINEGVDLEKELVRGLHERIG